VTQVELPVGWQWKSIGEVCRVIPGFAFKSKDWTDTGIPVIKIKNIQADCSVNTSICDCIPSEIFTEKLNKFVARKGDILIAMTGATAGKVGRLLANESFLINQRVAKLEPETIGKDFFWGVVSGRHYQELFFNLADGAAQPNMSGKQIEGVRIPVPPPQTQEKISVIIGSYDDLIENNTRRIEILEEMARRLYEEWFVQFRFPGHEGLEFKESELGLIPEGWDLTTVAETFEILGGGTPSKSEPAYWEGGQINWYSPTDLTRSGTAFMDESGTKITDIGLSRSSAKMFPPYSVMLTSRATIGVVAINTTPATTNQGFITCIPNKRFPLYLLFHWIKNNVDRFISLGTGATFKEITKGVFKGIELVVPPAALVDDFQQKVAPLMDMILRLQRKNRNLRTQRDLLLPKLISGEIDVSDIPMPT